MSARRRDPEDRTRVTLVCTTKQRDILKAAADASGTDLSTWVLAHGLRAAGAQTGAGAPMLVTGAVADRLRGAGESQGISAERALEQMLIAAGSDPGLTPMPFTTSTIRAAIAELERPENQLPRDTNGDIIIGGR